MRGIFPFIRNKLKNFTRGKKYRRAFVRVHPSTNLAMNNKKTRRNTNGKRNFRKDTRISWPGLRPLFSVERSCADEETGRGRGCWRTERERRRGKFRLVSLRFNRNPVRQHAGGDMCVYMGVYRLAHVAHYFQFSLTNFEQPICWEVCKISEETIHRLYRHSRSEKSLARIFLRPALFICITKSLYKVRSFLFL